MRLAVAKVEEAILSPDLELREAPSITSPARIRTILR
jgi:hypothetical protein